MKTTKKIITLFCVLMSITIPSRISSHKIIRSRVNAPFIQSASSAHPECPAKGVSKGHSINDHFRTLRYIFAEQKYSGRAEKNNHLCYKSGYFNNIITYFYCIKCLSESTYFLSHLCEQNYCYKPCNAIEQANCIQIDSTFFFHKKINSCLQTALHTESLEPIVALLQEVKHYLHMQDNLFAHEVFLLIFTVYKQILFQECEKTRQSLKKTTLTTIVEVSEKINQLPIAEVLNAVDMLMTELPPLLEKYELNSTITWQNWLKKYWWVPPIFSGWFALKILLSFQRSYYYDYHRHGHYRPSRLSDTIITDPELLNLTRDKNKDEK